MPEPTRGRFRHVAAMVVLIVFAVFVAPCVFAEAVSGGVKGDDSAPFSLAFGVVAVWIASVLFHEFGHLFVGLALRLRFLCFAFGPLRFLRSGTGFRTGIDADRATAAYVMFDWPMTGRARLRWALMTFAGPLTNILLVAACLELAHSATGLPIGAWRIAAAVNGYLVLASLLPYWSGGFRSDGGTLLDLTRGTVSTSTDEAVVREWREATGWKEWVRQTPPPEEIGLGWCEQAHAIAHGLYLEAAALGDDHIGTQHLLLAAVAELPAERRSALGIDEAAIRSFLGPNPLPPLALDASRPPTPRLVRAADIAASRATAYRRPVAVADVWFALLCDADSQSACLLRSLGLSIPDLRRALAPVDVVSGEDARGNAMTGTADDTP